MKLLATVFLAMSSPAIAIDMYQFNDSDNSVTWVAVGNPGFLEIEGEGAKVKGDVTVTPAGYVGTLAVELKGYKTGIGLRDEHMHAKYLESAKYPTAELKLDAGNSGKSGKFCGVLTIKGVGKPICGDAQVTDEGAGRRVKAKFKVNVKDYPIGVPSYLGVTMAETVDVTINAVALKK